MAELMADGKTYTIEAISNPNDRLTVEVGDSKQPDFYPQAKLMRWGNEVNFSARLIDDESAEEPTISTDGSTIVWQKPRKQINWYQMEPTEEHPEGAYEFQIDLLEKPDTNKIQFTIRTKGLDFFYQPALTADEIAEGCIRPDNVVGSYAVYYKDCPLNVAGGKEYKTGKAFHIYRPRVEDSTGVWVYGDLSINLDDEILTVKIPQEFLDNAVYPVRHAAGLTFGYNSIGASTWYCYNGWMQGCRATGAAGKATKFTAYCKADSGTPGLKGVLVKQSDKTIISGGVTNAGSVTTSFAWRDALYGTGPTLTAQEYYLCVVGNASFQVQMDTVPENLQDTTNSYASPTNPTDATFNNNKLSIYVTYTVSSETHSGGASAAPIVTSSHGAGKKATSGGAETTVALASSGAGSKGSSGGSGSEITVTAEGAGTAEITVVAKQGGSESLVLIVSDGSGVKGARSPPSSASVDIASDGAGRAQKQGGEGGDITTTSEGAGAKATSGGAADSISVSALGAGRKGATGGAGDSVTVTALGAGQAAKQGGAGAEVTITSEGGGLAAAIRSGGSSASITIEASGSGSKSAQGGSGDSTTVSAQGSGRKGAAGGSGSEVVIVAVGAGTVAADYSGGSEATISIEAHGGGTKAAAGGSATVVEVLARGAGSTAREGGGSAEVTIVASGAGTISVPIPEYALPIRAVISPTHTSVIIESTTNTAVTKPTCTSATIKPTANSAVVKSTRTKAVIE